MHFTPFRATSKRSKAYKEQPKLFLSTVLLGNNKNPPWGRFVGFYYEKLPTPFLQNIDFIHAS